jgi:hypothetical protein
VNANETKIGRTALIITHTVNGNHFLFACDPAERSSPSIGLTLSNLSGGIMFTGGCPPINGGCGENNVRAKMHTCLAHFNILKGDI